MLEGVYSSTSCFVLLCCSFLGVPCCSTRTIDFLAIVCLPTYYSCGPPHELLVSCGWFVLLTFPLELVAIWGNHSPLNFFWCSGFPLPFPLLPFSTKGHFPILFLPYFIFFLYMFLLLACPQLGCLLVWADPVCHSCFVFLACQVLGVVFFWNIPPGSLALGWA